MTGERDELVAETVDVLDRLHQLLTADQLHDGWRDDLDAAVGDAAHVLDALDLDDAESGIRNQESGSKNPETSEAVKRCPRCDTVKPTDEFHRNRSAHDGLQAWCKPCIRDYRRTPRARRLTEPTGQPPADDEPGRQPAHAGSPRRTSATIQPLT